jgi:hypothetical protein
VAIPTIGEISKPNVSPAAAPRMRSIARVLKPVWLKSRQGP